MFAASPIPPLSRRLALATHDLDAARQHLGAFFTDHGLDFGGGARALDCRHHHGRLDTTGFNTLSYGAEVTVSAPPLEDFYLLQFTLSGHCEIASPAGSCMIGAGHLLVMNPSGAYRKHWSADSAQLILRLDRRAIERRIAADLGIDRVQPVSFAFTPIALETAPSLVRFVDSICRDLDAAGPGLAHPHVRAHAEGTLAALVLSSLEHSYSAAYRGEERPSHVAPACVRRAEDFARAHAGEAIGLDQIAEAAGVSTRTLHKAFRHFRETTPLSFLKAVRLDKARAELARAAAEGRSVADVALACGMPHLGKFARDYQSRFGEKPSETRKRARL